jgi:hypothetical protein
MKIKDLDSLTVEQIIRLSFFHSLEKSLSDTKAGQVNTVWKITFRCNKSTASGWQLLDEFSENEYIVRYRLIDFNN